MMAIVLLTSLLLLLGLIYTIPPTNKLLISYLQSFHKHPKNPSSKNDLVIKTNNNNTDNDHRLKGVFGTFDKNNDGYITKQELKESLKNIGIHAGENDVADMVAKVDSNGDGLIDFNEFRKLFELISSNHEHEINGQDEDGDLREAFDVFDGNKDGVITVDELGLVLSSLGFNEGKMMENCKEMIRKVDIDGDGMIDFHEFKKMMKSGLILMGS